MCLRYSCRNTLAYFCFSSLPQWLVACHAPCKRPKCAAKVEAAHNFSHLPAAICFAEPIAAGHSRIFEQAAVAGQKNALFGHGCLHELGIAGAIPICGIKSEHSQVGCEFPQMDVQYEFQIAQRIWPDAEFWRYIYGLKNGVYGHAITIAHQIAKTRGHAVDKN